MSLYGDKISVVSNSGIDRISTATDPGVDNLTIHPRETNPLLNEDGETPLRNENGDIIYSET